MDADYVVHVHTNKLCPTLKMLWPCGVQWKIQCETRNEEEIIKLHPRDENLA